MGAADALTALGAAAAVAVELLEGMAIVLAVGTARRWSDALWGAAAGAAGCAVLAVALGPLLLATLPLDVLRAAIGVLLLLLGLEWLRKGVLRLAGRKRRSSAVVEYDETLDEIDLLPLPVPGRPDWAARAVAAKGVFVEGVEVVLIVAALAARPTGPAPAIIGATVAGVVVLAVGAWLRAPLARVPETELKYGVGLALSGFGVFFLAEGVGVRWPGGDLALLWILLTLLVASQGLIHRLAVPR